MSQVPGDDRALHAYLVRDYPTAQGMARFVMAVALLTFGHVDVVDEILANLPPVGHPARILARSVDALLPTNGDTLRDPDAVRAWFVEHRDRLSWNEQRGQFDLVEKPA
jgi:hypothetical protein